VEVGAGVGDGSPETTAVVTIGQIRRLPTLRILQTKAATKGGDLAFGPALPWGVLPTNFGPAVDKQNQDLTGINGIKFLQQGHQDLRSVVSVHDDQPDSMMMTVARARRILGV